VASLTLATLALAMSVRAWPIPVVADLPWARLLQIGGGTVGVLATLCLIVWSARGRPWALAALVLLVTADLGFWGYNYVRQPRPESIEAFVRRLELPPGMRRGDT